MRWLLLTIALLAASAGLLGWIYLRDRDTSAFHQTEPSERQLAQIAATATQNELDEDCRHRGCATVLRRAGPSLWLVRITVTGRARCLQINLNTFSLSRSGGLYGVQPTRCPR